MQVSSEKKCKKWDDVNEEREEASGDKLRNQLTPRSYIFQQKKDCIPSNHEAINYVCSK